MTNTISYGTDDFESIFYYHNEKQFKNVLRDVGHLFDLIHVHNEPDFMTVWADEVRKEKGFNYKLVHDWHDINTVRLGHADKYEILDFQIADGFVFVSHPIHKEMKELYKFSQPSVVFEHYCNKEWNGYTNYIPGEEDIARRKGIVYQGGLNPPDNYLTEEQRKLFRYRTMYYIMKEAVAQGNDLTIFAGNPQGYETHLDIGATVYPPTHYNELMKKMQNNKWCWCLFGDKENPQTMRTTANKMYEGIKTGCPVIACWCKETERIITELGAVIVLNDPSELGNIEKNYGHLYPQLKARVDEINLTGELDSENHIYKIENLYKQVLNNVVS